MQTVLLAAMAVGLTVGTALLGMWFVRRSVTLSTLEAHTEVAGFVYAVVGVVYSVLLAFVVVAVWQEHTQATIDAETEASALIDLSRLSGAMSPEDAERTRRALRNYAAHVRDEGWTALRAGRTREPRAVADAADALWQAYVEVSPADARGAAVYSESLQNLDEARDARRRLQGALAAPCSRRCGR